MRQSSNHKVPTVPEDIWASMNSEPLNYDDAFGEDSFTRPSEKNATSSRKKRSLRPSKDEAIQPEKRRRAPEKSPLDYWNDSFLEEDSTVAGDRLSERLSSEEDKFKESIFVADSFNEEDSENLNFADIGFEDADFEDADFEGDRPRGLDADNLAEDDFEIDDFEIDDLEEEIDVDSYRDGRDGRNGRATRLKFGKERASFTDSLYADDPTDFVDELPSDLLEDREDDLDSAKSSASRPAQKPIKQKTAQQKAAQQQVAQQQAAQQKLAKHRPARKALAKGSTSSFRRRFNQQLSRQLADIIEISPASEYLGELAEVIDDASSLLAETNAPAAVRVQWRGLSAIASRYAARGLGELDLLEDIVRIYAQKPLPQTHVVFLLPLLSGLAARIILGSRLFNSALSPSLIKAVMAASSSAVKLLASRYQLKALPGLAACLAQRSTRTAQPANRLAQQLYQMATRVTQDPQLYRRLSAL